MKDLSVVYTVLTNNFGFGGGHITRTRGQSPSRGSLIMSSAKNNLELGIRGSLATSQDTAISFGVSIK
jgi:hypothetical protein